MNQYSKKIIDELCDYLGYDLDSPMCEELHQYVKENPELRDYIDSIKSTVLICKDVYKKEAVPDAVKQKLYAHLKQKKQP